MKHLRFDSALKSYEGAAVRSKVTLSYLNIGQGFVDIRRAYRRHDHGGLWC